MKKWAAAIACTMLLSGCSLIDEANNTLIYANDMQGFLDETQQFAGEVPAMLETAASNPESIDTIQLELEEMQRHIDEVQAMEAPALAEGVHNKLVEYTEQMEDGIQQALTNIENGINPAALFENTELLKTVQDLQDLRTNIEQLGQ